MGYEFKKCSIPDVVHIKQMVFPDERGFFAEVYKSSLFKKQGIDINIMQVNRSLSQKNVLRGLHYQNPPNVQGKLVSVVKGEVFDVAVDIRKGSPTYGQWVGATLTAEEKNMLYIPSGFAHGFCVLSDEAEFIYYCTGEYSPADEAGIVWNDAAIGIDWPIENPSLSEKDRLSPVLAEARNGFVYEK